MALHTDASTKVLFIGDSITDCGRLDDPDRLGHGYVRMVHDYLLARDPARAPQIVNRGTSGNRITDLAARWQQDVIDVAPDVLSIKVGINDVWHGLSGRPDGVPLAKFGTTYRELLALTGSILPKCEIILCEPSVIWPPAPVEGNETLEPYIAEVNRLAVEAGVRCVVPLHSAFESAKLERPEIQWAPDGVHPSPAGHMLIAREWLVATGLL